MNLALKIAFRHWKPLLSLNVLLLAIATHFILSSSRTWTAYAKLIVPSTTSDLNADLGTLGNIRGGDGVILSQQFDSIQALTSIILSDDTISQVWKKDREKELYPRLNVYKQEFFHISAQSESTIISLKVDGSTPEIAQQRAIVLIETFQKRLQELREADVAGRLQVWEKELEKAEQDLQQSQKALTEFKQASNLVNSEDQTHQLLSSITTLANDQAEIFAQAQANEAKVKTLSFRLGVNAEQAIKSLNLAENPDYTYIRQKLAEVDALLADARSKFLEESPQIQVLVEQRQNLQSQLEKYTDEASANTVEINQNIGENSAILIRQMILAEAEAQALKQQANQLQNQINQLENNLQSIPAKEKKLLELQQKYDIAKGVYTGFVAQVQEKKISAFSTYPNVQVLDHPRLDTKSKTAGLGRRFIALGALLSCAFGSAALILWLEGRNPLLNYNDLQILEIPLLRSLPHLKRLGKLDILTRLEAEIEFQRLASTVSMMQLPKRRLMISSAILGEGKTTVTLGLAVALNNLGFRVLMIDGDFHKAELSHYLDYCQPSDANLSLKPIPIRPGLDLLPRKTQPEEMLEFLARGGFEQCLKVIQAAGNYDYLLVDSAPLSLTSETNLMTKVVSNVLLVVRPGVSHRHPLYDSIEQLERHQAKIIGLVVNGVQMQTVDYLYRRPNLAQVNS